MITLKNNKTSGVTVVEIGIVVLVVGLLLGGIISGQEMINSTRIRAEISQLTKDFNAITAFRAKYKALPGDYDKAAPTILGATTLNGNGDGQIAQDDGLTLGSGINFSTESLYFWEHLSLASMIDFGAIASATAITVGTTHPQAKVGIGGVFAYSSVADYNHYFRIGLRDATPVQNIVFTSNMPDDNMMTPAAAYGIDDKMDDGNAFTGNVRAMTTTGSGNSSDKLETPTSSLTCLQDATSGRYALNLGNNACSIRIRIPVV